MDTQFDVVIVSSYGRGNWLAQELTALKMNVGLVDVSEAVGRQTSEDVEGPFGFFESSLISTSQKARLEHEDYADKVEDGFVVWLKSGPIDTRGPQANHLLAQHNIQGDLKDYLEQYDQKTPKQRSEILKTFRQRPFSETWFAQLAHSLGSPVALESVEALTEGRPLPIFSPYSIRRASRMGADKSLAWLEENGVRVFKKAKIADVSTRGREVLNVEVQSEWSGVVGAERFVWALTSEETARLSLKFLELFFSSGELKPEWVWSRYRFEIQGEPLLATMPSKFLMFEDECLPWSHANMLWVQKTVTAGTFDVWMRLPAVHRFQRSYHESMSVEAQKMLQSRLPGAEVKVTEYPQEYQYDETLVGPARFQTYDSKQFGRHKTSGLRNVSFDGPELWPMLDWAGQFQHQNEIVTALKAWKVERDLKLEKLRAKELEKAK